MDLLICDLDNTLYNWVDYYAEAFRAMLSTLAEMSGIPEPDLMASFREVHRRHGTTEYSFAIAELPVLCRKHPRTAALRMLDRYAPAVEAFRHVREQSLHLYPGVRETLQSLRERGVTLVAYTDAMEFYALARLKRLALEPLLDYLYCAEEHALPSAELLAKSRTHSDPEWYRAVIPVKALLPSEQKPNARGLKRILRDVGARPAAAVAVGDSLSRDVLPAQEAGVLDVWARYGNQYADENYELIVQVTHRTPEDVDRERKRHPSHVRPTHVIDSFPDVLQVLDNQRPGAPPK